MGGVNVGGSYNYERYTGLQQSRSASPGEQQVDPNRDWTVDSQENVHYFSIYVQPPRIGTRTEMRVSYDYSLAKGNFFYEVGPALPPPSQLPEVFNKLQEFRFELRHRLSGRAALTVSYDYEPFRVYDFAFDPTVDQQHRAAQLAGPRLHVSAVHGALHRVRPPVLLVRQRRLPMTRATMGAACS